MSDAKLPTRILKAGDIEITITCVRSQNWEATIGDVSHQTSAHLAGADEVRELLTGAGITIKDANRAIGSMISEAIKNRTWI